MTVNPSAITLPAPLEAAVRGTLEEWTRNASMDRLWRRDASLWTGHDESHWLGWLDAAGGSLAVCDELHELAMQFVDQGVRHLVLLGMGGSSMAPEVFGNVFGRQGGCPELVILDSTDPGQIREVEQRIDLNSSVFIVASKSGTSLEPNILRDYFMQRVADSCAADDGMQRFIAITDPDTALHGFARQHGFLRTFTGDPEIGGRFSALSAFGMVPAMLAGIDGRRLLAQAQIMVDACRPERVAHDNPGLYAGAVLGNAALAGRDKLTLILSPALASFGAWLEQLVAESTGKQGRAIIPVDGEAAGPVGHYADDRLFIYLRFSPAADPRQDAFVRDLQRDGQPLLRVDLDDSYRIGQEFFRWEMATAVAGAVMQLNPFDQPDVEASKVAARRLTAQCESGSGGLPEPPALVKDGDLVLYADPKNRAELVAICGENAGIDDYLAAHLSRLQEHDYVALLAYLPRNENNQALLQTLRSRLSPGNCHATCLGFGPRFLHSTGQAYKGGANNGVFLQITAAQTDDLPVPDRNCGFAMIEAAQAQGDFEVMAARDRRLLGIRLGGDVTAGLERLAQLLAGRQAGPADCADR